MSNTTKKPVTTLRDGAIKATIWKNTGENGVFFSVTFARTYTNSDGNPQDTDSFTGSQLLKLSRIAAKAYDTVIHLNGHEKLREELEDEILY